MAANLQDIANQLIGNVTPSGQLSLDNTIIASQCFASLLGVLGSVQTPITSISVQVNAQDPSQDIYVKDNILCIKGEGELYNSEITDFTVQLAGQDEPTRTATMNGTLATLPLNQLGALGLVNSTDADANLPDATLTSLALQATADTHTPQLILMVAGSEARWPVLPEPLTLDLTNLGLNLQRPAVNQSSIDSVSASITGDFKLGNSSVPANLAVTLLMKPQLPAVTTALVTSWSIGLAKGSSGTIGLNDISLTNLLGGVNALGLLPPSLVQEVQSALDFELQELAIDFDPGADSPQKKVQSIVVSLSSSHSWPLVVSSFRLDKLQLTFTVNNPLLTTRTATAVLGGTLELGTPDNTLLATMQLPVLPASGSDWLLQATGQAQLSGFAALSPLPGSSALSSVALPDTLSAARITLTSFEVAYNPASKALAYLSLAAQVQDSWPVLGSQVELATPTLTAYVPGASLASPPPLTVAATAQLLLPAGGSGRQAQLALSASYVAGTGWTFTGIQAPDTTLNVVQLATYLLGIKLSPDSSLNLDGLTVSNLDAKVAWSSTGAATTYAFKGQTSTWELHFHDLPPFSLQATLDLAYDGTRVSGSVSVPVTLLGLSFVVSYELHDNKKQLQLTWQGFTFTYDNSSDTITATAAGSNWSIGSMLTALVNEMKPGDFSLPSPWDALNSVSLSGLKISLNLGTKALSVTDDLDVKLFFIEINKLGLTVQEGHVHVSLAAKFLGKPSQAVQWDAAKADPPAVPGSGSDLFDLRFAAFGQHVAVNNLPLPTTLSDFFATDDQGTYTYLQYFVPPAQSSSVVPVQPSAGTTPALAFSEASHWLLAADFTVAKFYTVQVVFADPVLYGLRIAINKDAAYFKNLDFEILYKKISDTIGLYQVDLQLPDQFRQLQFGAVSVTLPVIGIKVYTNGNFYLDFGFPASLTDFSRSFSVQVFPFTGYGGFYFGYLSGTTSTSVPTTTLGQFNPVIEAGLGLSLGVGKTFNEGILSAGLSLTAVGIFQGVLGFFNRYEAYDGRTTDTYYRFDATVALVGHVYGSVNFAIISAQFDITAYVSVTMTIEAYQPIPIAFSAGVSISLTVKINLGLFKVSISLHFNTTISASFSIGSDTSGQALWNVSQPTLGKQHQLELVELVLPPPARLLLWQPLLLGSDAPQALTAYFVPHLTVSAIDQAAYVAMLYLDAPAPGALGPETSSLGTLASGILAWTLNALLNSSSSNTTYADLLSRAVTTNDVQLLLCAFNSQPNSIPPFSYSGAPGQDVQSFLSTFFSLTIQAPGTADIHGAVLPPLPELRLQTKLKDTVTVVADFAQQNPAGTSYVAALTELLQSLGVNYETSLAASQQDTPCPKVPQGGAAPPVSQSLPAFFFADYVALLAKHMLQSSLACLNDTSTVVETVQDLLRAVRTPDVIGQLAGMSSRFLLHGLRLPAPVAATTLGTVAPFYVLSGQQFDLPALQAGDNYQVQLAKAASTNWLTFGGSTTDLVLPAPIPDDEIMRIADITKAAGQFVRDTTASPVPLPNYTDHPQLFTLGNPAQWRYPGTYFDGVSGNPTLLKLPATLLTELASGTLPNDFMVWALNRKASLPVPVAVQNYYWATSVAITVQRLTTSKPASPLQANTYSLVGADDAGVAFLQHLVEYLHAPGAPLAGTVQLLYQPAPATAGF
jgi:hypothetical protein